MDAVGTLITKRYLRYNRARAHAHTARTHARDRSRIALRIRARLSLIFGYQEIDITNRRRASAARRLKI